MKITVSSLSDLPKAAHQFLGAMSEHKVIAFSGEMGAGKTTFIKALCSAMGIRDVASSPTFSLVNEYLSEGGRKVYHFDFYRLQKESEALDMGVEEYFYSGNYCFIEWPEKIPNLLPADCLQVKIAVNDTLRELELS